MLESHSISKVGIEPLKRGKWVVIQQAGYGQPNQAARCLSFPIRLEKSKIGMYKISCISNALCNA